MFEKLFVRQPHNFRPLLPSELPDVMVQLFREKLFTWDEPLATRLTDDELRVIIRVVLENLEVY